MGSIEFLAIFFLSLILYLFNLISNVINGNDIHDFANYNVAVAIYVGLDKGPT